MASEKRCLYEILGLSRDCSPEEIRSAYRKLALQRHPDKLIQTGIPEEEATAAFQELVNAYEVLSDTRERSWYDSHRSQILFSDAKSSGSSSGFSLIPNLFAFFSNSVFSGFGDTGKGFFKVYSDLFGKIYAQEVSFAKKLGLGLGLVKDAPLMGNLESPYEQVSAFYNYWVGFGTVLDFCWVDEYDVLAGPNRKSRRLMEEENKKLRKKARKDYNETVRGLAEYVKKRDKRVIEMQLKRNLAQEKKKEEERIRKKETERAKLEKARMYEEPDWAKIEDEMENEFEEIHDDKKIDSNELYCVVCSKKFKSDKQWKNHEQSKKHREKVAELRYSFDSEEQDGKQEELSASDVDETRADLHPSVPVQDGVDELHEQFKDQFGFQEEQSEIKNPSSDEEETDVSDVNDLKGVSESFGYDEETSILEAMVSGHKSRKSAASVHQPKSSSSKPHVSIDSEEVDFVEYDNRKNTRRNRAAKNKGGKKSNEEAVSAEISEITEEVILKSNGSKIQTEEDNGHDDISHMQESSSLFCEETSTNGRGDHLLDKNHKILNQPVDRKGTVKRDTNAKLKNSSKGKKQKAASKTSGLSCETCGENFESRTKLHKHLGDTGHATLKSR
ncbi:hypothetical protein HHK36_007348 [Tetracentron sinense]|uniref:Uncharacterized protein n=1 Tax=Tetracentron sinense TaxID=13715 RepID=A0A834ZMG1_TETSI|nr:hypothetical protein HHK36_007348 [Tetracentron sinense]